VIDRDRIGFATPPTKVVIDRWQVKLFCQAIGESDPVYGDEAAAREAGHAACPVPPTFLKALETGPCGSAAFLNRLDIPVRSVLHAEQAFEYIAPVYVGDEIELTRTFSDTYDKKGGALSFVVLDSRFCRSAALLATSRQVIVVRNNSTS
jgi:hypothetical protein